MNISALQAEAAEGPHGRRVCRVFVGSMTAPELWHGTFGCAPCVPGDDVGFQLSDGEIVTI